MPQVLNGLLIIMVSKVEVATVHGTLHSSRSSIAPITIIISVDVAMFVHLMLTRDIINRCMPFPLIKIILCKLLLQSMEDFTI